jgi:hypothetical protein
VPFSRRLLRWEKEYRRGVAHEQTAMRSEPGDTKRAYEPPGS